MTEPQDVRMDIAKLDGRLMEFGTNEARLLLDMARRLVDDGFPSLAAQYVLKAGVVMDAEELWRPSLQRLLEFQRQQKPLFALDVHDWLVAHGWTAPADPNKHLKD